MKSYEGTPPGMVEVVENLKRRPLDPRLDLQGHSPDGFRWGYGGSGASQLALAILADYFGVDVRQALAWYQPFKWRAIANLKQHEPWTLADWQVKEVLAVLEAEAKT